MKFFNDIFSQIEFKGDKVNTIIKIIVGVASSAIITAFVIGQAYEKKNNINSDIKKDLTSLTTNVKSIDDKVTALDDKVDNGFKIVDEKIDKIYLDGFEGFEDYKEFNNKQLGLILDHNGENNDLLKEIIILRSEEKTKEIEIEIKKRRKMISIVEESNADDVTVRKVGAIENLDTNDVNIKKVGEIKYINPKHKEPLFFTVTEITSGLVTYYVKGASKASIDSINANKFEIIEISKNGNNNKLYNYKYIERIIN